MCIRDSYFLFLWHLCSRSLNDIRSMIKHAEHVIFKNLSARSVCITAHTFKNTETQRAKPSSSFLVLFQSDICVIDGSCYEDGDVNPHNASQVCRVGQQTTLWTVVTSKSSFSFFVTKCMQNFYTNLLKIAHRLFPLISFWLAQKCDLIRWSVLCCVGVQPSIYILAVFFKTESDKCQTLYI